MGKFIFATGIECSCPVIDRGRWRFDQLEVTGHYRHWRRDLELLRELKLRYLRYGPPLYKIFEGPGKYDWSFIDEVATAMREQGIVPIMDLCHFGVPDWLDNFQNPELPERLAHYADAFARRYSWVQFYTPINEMYVTARLSALEGVWNEQLRSEQAFVTALRHLAKASVLIMEAIQRVRPDAIFINSESSEFYRACCPDPEIQRIADFENQRRFIALDLVYGNPVRTDIRDYLFQHGMPAEEYTWFMSQRSAMRAVLGIDYYIWNEKMITPDGTIAALGELFGWYQAVELRLIFATTVSSCVSNAIFSMTAAGGSGAANVFCGPRTCPGRSSGGLLVRCRLFQFAAASSSRASRSRL